jgi:hypothetical protein
VGEKGFAREEDLCKGLGTLGGLMKGPDFGE